MNYNRKHSRNKLTVFHKNTLFSYQVSISSNQVRRVDDCALLSLPQTHIWPNWEWIFSKLGRKILDLIIHRVYVVDRIMWWNWTACFLSKVYKIHIQMSCPLNVLHSACFFSFRTAFFCLLRVFLLHSICFEPYSNALVQFHTSATILKRFFTQANRMPNPSFSSRRCTVQKRLDALGDSSKREPTPTTLFIIVYAGHD